MAALILNASAVSMAGRLAEFRNDVVIQKPQKKAVLLRCRQHEPKQSTSQSSSRYRASSNTGTPGT